MSASAFNVARHGVEGLQIARVAARTELLDRHHDPYRQLAAADRIEPDIGLTLAKLKQDGRARDLGDHFGAGAADSDDGPAPGQEQQLVGAVLRTQVVEADGQARVGDDGAVRVAQLAEVEGVAVRGAFRQLFGQLLGLAQELAGALVDGIAAELEGVFEGALDAQIEPTVDAPSQKVTGEHEHDERRQQRQRDEQAEEAGAQPRPRLALAQIAIQAPDLYSDEHHEEHQPRRIDGSRTTYSSPKRAASWVTSLGGSARRATAG